MRRLSRMNGWQRMWFAGTALSLVVFAFIYPVLDYNKRRDFTYRLAIEKDYNNPACAKFLEEPFEILQEPAYGDNGNCYHIYTSREFADDHEAFKTYDAWTSNDNQNFWMRVLAECGLLAVLILIASAIVYGLGRTIAWIVNGFRKPIQ